MFKQGCEYDHFQKSWKEPKNIFELQKKRWLFWLTSLGFDCDWYGSFNVKIKFGKYNDRLKQQ